MPKGFHRIKAHRPARGNPPCKRRDAQQQRGDDSEHGWFSRTHAKEKRMHGACFKNGAPNAGGEPIEVSKKPSRKIRERIPRGAAPRAMRMPIS